MLEGRQRSQWDHTASVLTMLANANRDPKKRRQPYRVSEFHPFAQKAKKERTKDISILWQVFCGG